MYFRVALGFKPVNFEGSRSTNRNKSANLFPCCWVEVTVHMLLAVWGVCTYCRYLLASKVYRKHLPSSMSCTVQLWFLTVRSSETAGSSRLAAGRHQTVAAPLSAAPQSQRRSEMNAHVSVCKQKLRSFQIHSLKYEKFWEVGASKICVYVYSSFIFWHWGDWQR